MNAELPGEKKLLSDAKNSSRRKTNNFHRPMYELYKVDFSANAVWLEDDPMLVLGLYSFYLMDSCM